MVAQALRTAGVSWEVGVEAMGWELMLRFVQFGLGIAVVNEFCTVRGGCAGIRLADMPTTTFQILAREPLRNPGACAPRKSIAQAEEESKAAASQFGL